MLATYIIPKYIRSQFEEQVLATGKLLRSIKFERCAQVTFS
jgi:hypothetical protein